MPAADEETLITNMTRPSEDGLAGKICSLIGLTLDLPPDFFPLRPETRLYGAGLGLDSLDTLRLVASLEEEFGLTIDDTELTPSTFESVGSIVSLVQGKLASAP